MSTVKNITINYDTNSVKNTKNIGNTINFYTNTHNYVLVSPTPTTFAANTYYTKEGTNYILITETGENTWEEATTNHKNIYKRDHTQDVDCPVCNKTGTILYRTDNTKTYTCPRCNGKGTLIKATGVEILGISVFCTKDYEKRQVKYQVVPPGGISSILVPEEDLV